MSLKYDSAILALNDVDMFWAFFKANEPDINKILWSAALRYENIIDPKDLRHDLVLRLQRSNFLRKFDPQKSQISTFFIGRVSGYAHHMATAELARTKNVCNLIVHETDEDEECNGVEFSQEAFIEEDLDANFVKEAVLRRLRVRGKNSPAEKVFMYRLDGYSFSEIADMLKCSRQYIFNVNQLIKEALKKVIDKN